MTDKNDEILESLFEDFILLLFSLFLLAIDKYLSFYKILFYEFYISNNELSLLPIYPDYNSEIYSTATPQQERHLFLWSTTKVLKILAQQFTISGTSKSVFHIHKFDLHEKISKQLKLFLN